MTKQKQLALSVQLPDDETFVSYQGKSNQSAIETLKLFITPGKVNEKQTIAGVYLFGGKGVGKSHLLHAACTFATDLKLTSVCLSLTELVQYSPEVLEGLEQMDLVCLDDVQLVALNNEWQQAIFDLFNRINECGKKIIITGDTSVQELPLTLPDLKSRLSWGYVEQIKGLTDEEKLQAIQFRAGQRGLTLPLEVARFLISRLTRDMPSLIEALDILDQASIREQRKITIPFIKDVLF